MTGRKPILLFGGGLATGLLVASFLGAGAGPAVQAQPAAVAAPGRYQVSAFGSSSGATPAERGAYILDTQTGELSVITRADQEPVAAGSAARPKKR